VGNGRYIAGPVALLLTVGCGSGPAEPGPDDAAQDESRCLSCGTAPTPPLDEPSAAAPKVVVSPSELMFYPWSTDSTEFGPKAAYVVNLTEGIVAVTHVQIGDDPKQPTGGRAYFEVEPITDKIFLEKGAQAVLWVTYLGSVEQESAVMVITTTDPVYHTLYVFLTGKLFIEPAGS
jgi:hypothetical protein